jgi:hypothetical protein
MAEYVALLRGINVGGNNIIKMSDLRGCFESSLRRRRHVHPERQRAVPGDGAELGKPGGVD